MVFRILPDVELLVIDWLRTVDELDGVEIHSSFGPGQSWPAVRIIRVGGVRPWPPHLDQARIQIEGWSARVDDGGSKAEALNVVETVLAALLDGLPGVHDEGVVSAVDVGLAPTWSPDQTTNQPRYVADVLITAHPNPNSPGS